MEMNSVVSPSAPPPLPAEVGQIVMSPPLQRDARGSIVAFDWSVSSVEEDVKFRRQKKVLSRRSAKDDGSGRSPNVQAFSSSTVTPKTAPTASFLLFIFSSTDVLIG